MDVFNTRQIQDCKALLESLTDRGIIKISDAITLIDKEIPDKHGNKGTVLDRIKRLGLKQCPSCGKMTLRTVAKIDGLNRIGCRCGYSSVVS